MVDIAFITDKNYILPTKVAIRSIIKNAAKDTYVTIHVIGDVETDLSGAFVELEADRFHIDVIYVSKDMRMTYNREHLYVSPAALYKFMLPELLQGLDKVLYLDGDVIVESDLQELFDIDIEGFYLAAVEDMCAVKQENVLCKIGNSHYFNSGVMLLNLATLRSEDMTKKLIEERMRDEDMHFMDQNVLNRLLGKKVIYLPLKYNCITDIFAFFAKEEIASFYAEPKFEDVRVSEEMVIEHFAGGRKPWDTYEAYDFEKWYSYLESEEIPFVLKRCYKQFRDEIEKKTERAMLFKVRQINESFDYLLAEKQKEIDGLKALIAKYIPKAGAELNKQSEHQEKKYVIYGAGDYAMQVFRKCRTAKRENEILAFAVTDEKKNPQHLFGIPVVSAEELTGQREKITVIVAVNKAYLQDVLNKLSDLGFTKIERDGLAYEW